MSPVRLLALLILATMSSLVACGQTGDLYLPEAAEPVTSTGEADEQEESGPAE